MADDKIEISKFNFWLITTVLGTLLVGIGAWATSMNSQMVKQQIAMAGIESRLASLDKRLVDNLNLSQEIYILKSDVRALTTQANSNTAELASGRGDRFDMSDYDKYVRPVNEALLQRVTKIEAKIDRP